MDRRVFVILASALLVSVALTFGLHLSYAGSSGPDAAHILSLHADVSTSFHTSKTNAEYALYACRNTAENHIHDLFAATGSCWFISGERYLSKSDGNGYVRFDNLNSGEYRLLEVNAHPEYERAENQWEVIVNAKGVLTKMIK